MLKTRVKVGKITNLSDARYCAGMGVDWLGFPIGIEHNNVDPKKYKEITDWISGPSFILEWMGPRIPENFLEILGTYNADLVEIDVHQLRDIPDFEAGLIVRMGSSAWADCREELLNHRKRIHYLEIQVDNFKAAQTIVKLIGTDFPVLLSGGISADTLNKLDELKITGISLEGTSEDTPGFKDYSHLSEILERLEL